MPRFHFNVFDGSSQFDVDGTELPDLAAARTEAVKLAGEIIRNAGVCAEMGEEWRVEVTNDSGLMLFRMDFTMLEVPATAQQKAAE